MQHRHAPLYRRYMSHNGKVVCFLHRRGGKHCKAGCAACHYILVVAENAQGVCCQRAAAHMKYTRQQLARYFVHVGYHQHQSLRGCEGSCERSCGECSVSGSGSSEFRLHLAHLHCASEKIFHPFDMPLVGGFSHRGYRSYGIYCGYLAECVGYVCGCGAAVCSSAFHGIKMCEYRSLFSSCRCPKPEKRNQKHVF